MSNRHLDWLRQAEADLESAGTSLRGGHFEWACFAAQQAAEKAVKAIYVKKGGGRLWPHHHPAPGRAHGVPPRERVVDFLPLIFPVGIDLFVFTPSEFDALRTNHPSMRKAIDSGIEL